MGGANRGKSKTLHVSYDELKAKLEEQRFPALAGSLIYKINCTLLFDSKQEQKQSRMIFNLKFANNYRIVRQVK